jgi:hypothetical protein
MTPDEEVRRAGEARQVLDAPIFQQARKNLEDQMAQLRRNVPIRETEMHTRLILMEQLADRFFGYFEQLAQTGRMAEIHMAEERERQSMIDRGLAMFRTTGRNGM